jgi:galactokinase
MPASLQEEFVDRYGHSPEQFFFCPGRVNLIGEHIDYNGGRVMPCAISLGTSLAIAKNNDKTLRFASLDFQETVKLHLQSSYSRSGKGWFNYPLGVINAILNQGGQLSGLDMLYSGNLPVGAGLSSSASIEVLTSFALNEMFGLDIPLQEQALLSQKVENEFIGVNSGIMDQFAVALGKKNMAILLDCDTLEHEFVPFDTREYSLMIINTNKKRELADSKYNERFTECGAALKMLKTELDIANLCDLNEEKFKKHKHLITDQTLLNRTEHVVKENARVRKAAIALKGNDLHAFGRLMFDSHQSLKDIYEVSCKELDCIVDYSAVFKGCIGARMTGAGFGGCAIALVEKSRIESFSEGLISFYAKSVGYQPSVFVAEISDGVRVN